MAVPTEALLMTSESGETIGPRADGIPVLLRGLSMTLMPDYHLELQ